MLEEPSTCPKCKGENIRCDDTDRVDYDTYIETWYCEECDCLWNNIFELTFKKIKIEEDN